MRATTRAVRILVMTGAAGLALLTLGFIVFAGITTRRAPDLIGSADGIVVLTGAERRIEEGMRLLHDGHGRRLLISGVNQSTRRTDVRRIVGSDRELFSCCVDMGYAARDTIGNADEARGWAERWQFKRLIVVTSSYHMPRGLTELARALPDAELIAYPVVPRQMGERGAWWLNGAAIKVLLAEYVKLFPAVARLAAARLFGAVGAPSLVGAPAASALTAVPR